MPNPLPLMVHGAYCCHIHHGQRNNFAADVQITPGNCYELVGVHHGSISLRHEGRRTAILAPAALLLPPRHPARVDLPAGAQWERLNFDVVHVPLRFSSATGLTTVHRRTRPQPPPERVWGYTPPLRIADEAVPGCLNILRYCNHLWWRDHGSYVRANARLQRWLTDYLLHRPEAGGAEDEVTDPWLREVVEAVRKGLEDHITTEDLARQVSMGRRQFGRRLAAVAGETPKELILRVAMERARELMAGEHRYPVANTAQFCGYRSAAAFSRAFTRYHGVSPGRWRREHRPGA